MGSRWQELGGQRHPVPPRSQLAPLLRCGKGGLGSRPRPSGQVGTGSPVLTPGGPRDFVSGRRWRAAPLRRPRAALAAPLLRKARSARSVPGLTPGSAALEEAGVT